MTLEIVFVWLTCATYESERDVVGENGVWVIDGSEVLIWDEIWILVIVNFVGILGVDCDVLLGFGFKS